MAAREARVPAILHEDRPAITHHAKTETQTPTILVSLCSGSLAGAIAKTTIAPLDRTKINFQTSHTPYSWSRALAFIASSVRAEGWRSLWRGNSATMARIVPYAGVQFAAHEQWKRVLGVNTPQTARENQVRLFLAGSLAGVTSQSVTYPLDVARARMAVAARAQAALPRVLAAMWRERGGRAMFRGYLATILGVIPYAGVSFFTYDTLKRKYKEHRGAPASGLANVALGGCAGALAQTASYPLDIIRRRIQVTHPRADQTYLYDNITNTAKILWQMEGWRGFFKGLSMNWVKGPLAVGVSFATYDAIKTFLTDLALRLDR